MTTSASNATPASPPANPKASRIARRRCGAGVGVIFAASQLVHRSHIQIQVSAAMQRVDVDAAKRAVHDLMQIQGKLPVMIELEPGFSGLQAFASWDDIDVDRYIKEHIVRLAVVGDLRWRDNALLFLFNSVVPFQIEYFPANQKEFALA